MVAQYSRLQFMTSNALKYKNAALYLETLSHRTWRRLVQAYFYASQQKVTMVKYVSTLFIEESGKLPDNKTLNVISSPNAIGGSIAYERRFHSINNAIKRMQRKWWSDISWLHCSCTGHKPAEFQSKFSNNSHVRILSRKYAEGCHSASITIDPEHRTISELIKKQNSSL